MIHSNTVIIFLAHSGTRRFGSASHTNFKLCVHCILKLSGISARKTEPVTAGADSIVQYCILYVRFLGQLFVNKGQAYASALAVACSICMLRIRIFLGQCAVFGIMLAFKCVTTASSAQRTYNILFIHCPKNIATMPVTAGAVATVYTCFCAYTYIYSVWRINQSVGLYAAM